MTTWSDEEKLNVIGTHEKGHEKGGLLVDRGHKQSGGTISDELVTRFQYSIKYPDKSSSQDNWLKNYNNRIGNKNVNNAYKKAVKGLVKAGDVSKDEGSKLIDDFTSTNSK